MKNKDFIEKNIGKDILRGRPIRLNKVTLVPRQNKNYAELIFFGDVHLGYPTCNLIKAKKMLDYALEKNIYVLLMGDLIEAGLRDSVGNSVYKQTLNPQEQLETVIELLTPLAKKKLIIGLHEGNHENRITKSTGIDITKVMAKILKVPYLGYACWSLLSVNNRNYTLYSTHGSSGSKFKHTKLKAVIDQCAWIDSDILAMGHVHSVASEVIIKQKYNGKRKIIEENKQYVCLTGSYINWDKSYAQMKSYPPTRIGSPKAKLFTDHKDIHFSL